MQLTGLTELLREHTAYHDVLAALNRARTNPEDALSLNVIRAARPFIVAALAQAWQGPIIYLTDRIKRAYNLAEQLPVWLDSSRAGEVLRFAEPASQFYERVPWGEIVIRERLKTLAALMPPDDVANTLRPIVVASARAVMQRTLPVNRFRQGAMLLEARQRHTLDKLLARWLALGYEPVTLVTEPGTFSRRGGVLDIFPMASDRPVRVEFFDDEIESLRLFDVTTQRSAGLIERAAITPAREALPEEGPAVAAHLKGWFNALQPPEDDMTAPSVDAEPLATGAPFPYLEHYLPFMYPNAVSLLDYAPPETLVVIDDLDDLREAMQEIIEQADSAREEQQRSGQIPHDYPQPYIDLEMLMDGLRGRPVLQLGGNVGEEGLAPLAQTFSQLFTPGARFGGQLRAMLTTMRDFNRAGDRIILVTQQPARLSELWYEQDASDYVPVVDRIADKPAPGALLLLNGVLHEGWALTAPTGEKTHLLTEAEVFGWNRPEPRRRIGARRGRSPEADYADWNTGDYVVHVDYGIGQFTGMKHRTVEGTDREYLVVQYGGTDMLYVPIHQADRLTKYIGADDTPPVLNKLGQQDWIRIKSKARKAIEDEARDLLALYAERAQAAGYAFKPDTPWQHELEATFPFIETEDQLRSVREVKADMERAIPMDRLICGDVGYGKTEVALRATFKSVMDGKQVAILVPTTVLAQQHYETFSARLAAFPIKVEMMSRFRTKEQQRLILPRLASGEIDIIIGTHRILSDDVKLKDLGLVIIDEEQRFGVKHKEHFKQLRKQVDVLTLTATPIPRTLYMGLTGVRDISMIQTPPEERLPVITHVGRFEEKLVRQAIVRELERGGQVFVVHNRVRTIETLRDKLEEIVPEARIIVGHGQMYERQLEHVMARFARGEYDILLSTSIIESGIDMPNVNTLIVDRADWFGMAQLYQLRGRVGRSAQQAYAYFFHPSGSRLTEEARMRLETLAENTSLGSGYQIAMRDLEMRGAGDILSTQQTGHVASIGLHLYTQLLTQAVQQLKGDKSAEPPPAATSSMVIDLPIAAYLPSDWIEEMALRLQIYRRIAGLNSPDEVEAMRAELRDRFGQLPAAVEGLLYQMEIKQRAQAAYATHVMARDGKIDIRLPYLGEIDRGALQRQLGEGIQVSRTAVSIIMDDVWRLRLLDVLTALALEVETSTGL